MKNIIGCIAAALVLSVSAASFAIIDSTYLGQLKPHETKTITVSLSEGSNKIEVFNPYEESSFNCSFTDAESGFTGLVQDNVTRCVGHTDVKYPLKVIVKFTSLSDKSVDYRVTAGPSK